LQFLYYGALNGEKGLYISLEENVEDLIRDMEEIGFDKANELIEKNLLSIEFYSPLNFEYLSVIDELINKGYQRLVIYSISSISLNWDDKTKFRKFMLDFVQAIKKAKITAVMIDEQAISINEVKAFSSEYLSDAVIELFYASLGAEFDRSMQILKMRRTPIKHGVIPMKIDKGGIYVK
jgi:KaiC/GvpD/RAD55 family RecA-like ATPase